MGSTQPTELKSCEESKENISSNKQDSINTYKETLSQNLEKRFGPKPNIENKRKPKSGKGI